MLTGKCFMYYNWKSSSYNCEVSLATEITWESNSVICDLLTCEVDFFVWRH